MGLPSYIINFDELKQPIMDAIKESDINIAVGDITLDSAEINISTKEIEDILDKFSVQLTNITDTNKLAAELSGQILAQLAANNTIMSEHMNRITERISAILTETININDILNDIKEQLASDGKQEMHGYVLVVPAITGQYTKTIEVPNNILFTGFSISQSAWNHNDKWSLKTNTFTMFNNIFTKQRGEHKQLNKFLPVSSGNTFTFTFDNADNGQSKYVWFDLEYINLDNLE